MTEDNSLKQKQYHALLKQLEEKYQDLDAYGEGLWVIVNSRGFVEKADNPIWIDEAMQTLSEIATNIVLDFSDIQHTALENDERNLSTVNLRPHYEAMGTALSLEVRKHLDKDAWGAVLCAKALVACYVFDVCQFDDCFIVQYVWSGEDYHDYQARTHHLLTTIKKEMT